MMAGDGYLEQIGGPVNGCYIACYTVPGTGGYIGYAKLFRHPPASVWESDGALRKVSMGPLPQPQHALSAVRLRAAWMAFVMRH